MLFVVIVLALASTVASVRLGDAAAEGIQDIGVDKGETRRTLTNLTLAEQLVEAGFGGFTCGESMAFKGEARLAMEYGKKGPSRTSDPFYCAPIYDMAFAVTTDEDFQKAFPKCRKIEDRVHAEMCGMTMMSAGVCNGDQGLPPSVHVWDCRQNGMLQFVQDYFVGMAQDAALSILFPPYAVVMGIIELPLMAKDAYETATAIEEQERDRVEVARNTEQFFETERAGITEFTLAATVGVPADAIKALKKRGTADQVKAVRAVYDALRNKAEEVEAAGGGKFLQLLSGLPRGESAKPAKPA